MPRVIIVKTRFDKIHAGLSDQNKYIVGAALMAFREYLRSGTVTPGLGIKCLSDNIYEFRAGLALRVVYVFDGDKVILELLGNHDEIRKFLKNQ